MSDRPDPELRPSWSVSDRFLPRTVLRPLQDFLSTSTASAFLLLVAAVVALVWANSPFGDAYDSLWHTEIGVGVGSWSIELDLQHWVNDGLMAIFFFVVGLEIKREVLQGELRDPTARRPAGHRRRSAGMVVPALLYVAFNAGGEGAAGWGIPMATDIAFARRGAQRSLARHASGDPQAVPAHARDRRRHRGDPRDRALLLGRRSTGAADRRGRGDRAVVVALAADRRPRDAVYVVLGGRAVARDATRRASTPRSPASSMGLLTPWTRSSPRGGRPRGDPDRRRDRRRSRRARRRRAPVAPVGDAVEGGGVPAGSLEHALLRGRAS